MGPVSEVAPATPTTIAATEWRAVPAENLLVIDTTRGRILLELMPEVAPLHVERIKLLARRGFYDNIPWHRVIDTLQERGVPLGALELLPGGEVRLHLAAPGTVMASNLDKEVLSWDEALS